MSRTHSKVYSPHNEVFGDVSPSKGDWLDDTVVWGRDAVKAWMLVVWVMCDLNFPPGSEEGAPGH